jgi:hypothetical protein
MIDISESIIRSIVFHSISSQENKCFLSNDLFDYETDEQQEFIKKFFLKPFSTNSTTLEFNHLIDLNLNPLYKISKSIYNEDKSFIEDSKHIYQHLKSVSKHPKIKDGDLFIVKFEDLKIGNQFYEGLGIYKIESKDTFFEIDGNNALSLKKGIGLKKLDKACLVIFTNEPYTVLVVDNSHTDTDYWTKEFVNVNYKNDNFNNTNQFLSLTKSYITKELPKSSEVSRAEQIDLLNRSVDYFQSNESFEKPKFEQQVLRSKDLIDTFRDYELNYMKDKKIEIEDNFEISKQVVKKQSKSFKRVLKLDKSVDIYIHGSQDMIEKGIDSQTGRKYYKIYYNEEI